MLHKFLFIDAHQAFNVARLIYIIIYAKIGPAVNKIHDDIIDWHCGIYKTVCSFIRQKLKHLSLVVAISYPRSTDLPASPLMAVLSSSTRPDVFLASRLMSFSRSMIMNTLACAIYLFILTLAWITVMRCYTACQSRTYIDYSAFRTRSHVSFATFSKVNLPLAYFKFFIGYQSQRELPTRLLQ